MSNAANVAARFLVRHLPKTRLGYRAARAYLNWYRGENNHFRESNGETWLLDLVLPHCSVVFDVGANVGDWASDALKTNQGLRLHCFEPAAQTFALLQRRALGEYVICKRVALSDRDGEAQLTVVAGASDCNSIVCAEETSYGRPESTECVPSLRFDTYLKSASVAHVDLVKLDVEGAEYLVLSGMERSLREGRVDAVQFEYGRMSIYGRVFLRDYLAFFDERGFISYKLVQNGLHHFERYVDELESFEYQNWVAVRRGSLIAGVLEGKALFVRGLP